jgi:hypothetical protein
MYITRKVLIFKIEKVTKYYHSKYGVYEDFIIGNYSYSTDNGNSYVINTITQNSGINNPNIVSLYTSGMDNQNLCIFTFKDALIQKNGCNARFEFLQGSNNQVNFKLSNPTKGYILPETPPNPYFSIPDRIVLTKQ